MKKYCLLFVIFAGLVGFVGLANASSLSALGSSSVGDEFEGIGSSFKYKLYFVDNTKDKSTGYLFPAAVETDDEGKFLELTPYLITDGGRVEIKAAVGSNVSPLVCENTWKEKKKTIDTLKAAISAFEAAQNTNLNKACASTPGLGTAYCPKYYAYISNKAKLAAIGDYNGFQTFLCIFGTKENQGLGDDSSFEVDIELDAKVLGKSPQIKIADATEFTKDTMGTLFANFFLSAIDTAINAYQMSGNTEMTVVANQVSQKIDAVKPKIDGMPDLSEAKIIVGDSGNNGGAGGGNSDGGSDCSLNPSATASGAGWILDIIMLMVPLAAAGRRTKK